MLDNFIKLFNNPHLKYKINNNIKNKKIVNFISKELNKQF